MVFLKVKNSANVLWLFVKDSEQTDGSFFLVQERRADEYAIPVHFFLRPVEILFQFQSPFHN
jgi:hypothetical protein